MPPPHRDPDRAQANHVRLVTFGIDDVTYGIDASVVTEVVRMVSITPVPSATPLLEGAVNVRGTIVPVLDFRHRLALPPRELDPSQFLVIATAGHRRLAFRVDAMLDLETADPDDVMPASGVPGARFTTGFLRLPSGLLLIPDLVAFLAGADGDAFDAAFAAWVGIAA